MKIVISTVVYKRFFEGAFVGWIFGFCLFFLFVVVVFWGFFCNVISVVY